MLFDTTEPSSFTYCKNIQVESNHVFHVVTDEQQRCGVYWNKEGFASNSMSRISFMTSPSI